MISGLPFISAVAMEDMEGNVDDEKTFQAMQPGIRVVRGPDWDKKRQDGGEGHVGTIVYVPKAGSSDEKVTVIWDNGRELRYRAGHEGKYDLRVFDNGCTGVIHDTITCDVCRESPLVGIRWKCIVCEDFDLCPKCYMSGKHDLTHGFLRMDTAKSRAVAVAPRTYAKTMPILGVFKGAKVKRGPHWKRKNDDGGGAGEGEVLEVVTWNETSYRGGVRVKWKDTKKEGVYRMAGEGCIDVICINEIMSEQYYLTHLPVVDIVNPGIVKLKPSDKIRVNLNVDEFKSLQDHKMYGGWEHNDQMVKCIQELGTVVGVYFGGQTAKVQYLDGQERLINSLAATRVMAPHTAAMKCSAEVQGERRYENGNTTTTQQPREIHSFTKGEAVTIHEDFNAVRKLQDGHGGWNDKMKPSLGQVGRIVRIDVDGDIQVKFGDTHWTFNPVACSPVEDPAVIDSIPDLSKSELEVKDGRISARDVDKAAAALADLYAIFLKDAAGRDDEDTNLVEAAAHGELDKVKMFIRRHPEQVDTKVESKTALHLAAYEGQVEVVKFLLQNNADTAMTDNEGDTALHFAAFGQEEIVMKVLLDHKAGKDVRNKKGLAPLHITIGKASLPCTELLLKYKASINVQDNNGDTPMHDCILQKTNQVKLLTEILSVRDADFSISNNRGFDVLQWATLKNCIKAAEIVVHKNKGIANRQMKKEGFTALHIAAATDHVEIASLLLTKTGCSLNAQDKNQRTPLHIAVTQRHKRVAELLISAGTQSISLFRQLFALLLQTRLNGANVKLADEEGNTPLHVAQITNPLSDELDQLLGIKGKQDDVDLEIMSLLIHAGAPLDVKNSQNETPLSLCIDTSTREFLKSIYKKRSEKTFATSTSGVLLPLHWTPMDKTETFIRVPLNKSSGLMKAEFGAVEKNFRRTMAQSQIIEIERVQNIFAWEHYTLKKRELERDYGQGCSNELDLFHGTTADKVDIIAEQNLDHRLAGDRVGTLFGQGSYFAKDAKYSDGYATADETTGHKCMFQVKVLAGKCTLGDPSYKLPPNVDEKDPKAGRYNACVDNIDKPRIFCIFDNTQYYPEYIIEYK